MASLSLFRSRVEAIAPNGLGLSGRRCFPPPPPPLSLNRREEDAPPPLRGRRDGRTTDKVSRGETEEDKRKSHANILGLLLYTKSPSRGFSGRFVSFILLKNLFFGMRIKRCSKQMGKKLVPEANI